MRKLFLFSIFSLVIFSGFSQGLERYNWYFGGSTQAVRFNRTSAKPSIVTKTALGLGGSGTASNSANANLLFYTNGVNVYDASNTQLTGVLSGNPSANQPVAMCPVPGDSSKFFVFTNSANFTTGGTIRYSIIDMNLGGSFPLPPLGDFEPGKRDLPTGLTGRAEGMIIVPHANGTDFWLITASVAPLGSTTPTVFSATLVNAASYTTGTFAPPPPGASITPPLVAGNLSYNPAKKLLAVSPQDLNDAIILGFDPATGTFPPVPAGTASIIKSSGKTTPTAGQGVYDIEWSLNSNFLYLSRFGEAGFPADLFQYDYSDPNAALTSVLSTPVFRSFGLQMAPDSNIYHLYQSVSGGAILMGAITHPDSVAAKVVYKTAQLTNTDLQGMQFPAFAPKTTVSRKVDFTFTGTCQNNNTTFYPSIWPTPDSVSWDFADPSTPAGSNDWSPVHKYKSQGSFNVTLTAFFGGQTQTAQHAVNIAQFDLTLTLVQDTTACRFEFPPKRGIAGPPQFSVTVKAKGTVTPTYLWSNGQTGATLKPDSAGFYYVVATAPGGCSTYAGVNVKEYDLQDQRRNIWFFGDHAGLDFNKTPVVPLTNSAMLATDGCAIVCDRDGKTIFYTNGNMVYNRLDAQIASGIGGEISASQSSIIVPVPGDETLYYIFTNEAVTGQSNIARYSLFDLKLNGGTGGVPIVNRELFARSTERITASGKWVIIHEWGNNTFRVYPFSAAGIGEPVLTAIGSDHSSTSQSPGKGYMKLGPNNTLAVAVALPGSNLVELFHLNDTTGKLTNYRKIDLGVSSGEVYGIEFAGAQQKGNKLYASIKDQGIYEYFIDSLGHPTKVPGSNPFAQAGIGALQVGPDGRLYGAVNGATALLTIQPNGDPTLMSTYTPVGQQLAGRKSSYGLPNFIQQQSNAFGGPEFSFTGICLQDTTRFLGVPTDPIDQFSWQFDATGSFSALSTSPKDSIQYPTAGNHVVTMRVYNRCITHDKTTYPQGFKSVTHTVTIHDRPPKPIPLPQVCDDPPSIDAYGLTAPPPPASVLAGLKYAWPSGDTTRVIFPQLPTQGKLIVTNEFGCTETANVFAVPPADVPPLGPDQAVCQNTPGIFLPPVVNNFYVATWSKNGVVQGTPGSQRLPVDTSVPGIYKYELSAYVPSPIPPYGPSCTVTHSVTYTVNPSPIVTMTAGNTTGACGATNGSLAVTLAPTNPATGPYSIFLTGPGGFNDQKIDQVVTPPTPVTYNYTSPTFALGAGVYSAIVLDQISQCQTPQSIGINDNAAGTAAAVNITNCDPETIRITTAGMAFPIQYTVTNNATPGTLVGTFNTAGPSPFNIPTALTAGTYTISLKDAGGCTFNINNFAVTPNPPVPVTITPNLCVNPPTLKATGTAPSYTWSGTGTGTAAIVGPTNSSTLTLTGQGQFTYTVLAAAPPGGCPNTITNTVTLDTVVPDFTQSDQCQSTVVLQATPASSAYTYRWLKSGVIQPNFFGQQITVTTADNGASYQVEVSNAFGCAFRSNPKIVNVIGAVTAGITAAPACADGKPFLLTAVTSATGPTFSWYKNNTVIAGQTASTTSQSDEATYKIEISKAGCKATAQVAVKRNPLPVGTLPNREVICNDPDNKDPKTNNVDLDPGPFTKYNWFKNELALNYTARVYNATSQGKYRVDLTNSFGCVAPDEVEVRSECIPRIDVPNAFRPTSSVNDNKEFYAFTFFITDANFQVFIYNRWGELIFSSPSRDFKWNGGYNNNINQPLPGGSYAWVIKYVSAFHPERGVQEKRGGVTLLR